MTMSPSVRLMSQRSIGDTPLVKNEVGTAAPIAYLGIAYVTDESCRACITCWKEKVTRPEDLLTGQVLHVRACKKAEKAAS